MTHKRFTLLLQSSLHSLVFLSLCLAPLLHNVLYNIQNETAVESIRSLSTKTAVDLKATLDLSGSEDNTREVGLNNSLKDFWSLTRLSQRYFAQRKNTNSVSLYSKAIQTTTQSVLSADSKPILEQPISHLAYEKSYLSQAKLRLEGG